MREHLSLALTIIVLMFSPTKAQIKESPFYANQNPGPALLDNVQLAQYAMPKGNEITDVDAHQILEPVMRPFVTMFDVMQQNAKAHKYAEKVQQERDSSPFSNSKSIFDLFEKLQRPTTTPTPAPSLVQQLFQPYLEPWQRQLDSISKEMAGITLLPPTTTPAPTTTAQRSLLERSLGMFFPSFTERRPTPAPSTTTPEPAREIRRSPARLFDPEVFDKLFNLFNPEKVPRPGRAKRQAPKFDLPTLSPVPDFFSAKGLSELFDPLPKVELPSPVTVGPPPVATTPAPQNNALAKLFTTEAPKLEDIFNPWKPNPILNELNKPVILNDPFTPNPLMGMFTTKKPLPEFKLPEMPKAQPIYDPLKPHLEPQFKLQDPFYNPLFPNRKSKLFDFLAGGEAAKILGK